MEEILRPLLQLAKPTRENLIHVVDILLVSYLIYRVLSLIRGTRAWRILGGIVFYVLLLSMSSWFNLDALHWILDKATILAPVALVILLLPELRQALEGFGKLGLWPQRIGALETSAEAQTVEELVAAASELSALTVGALIIIERGTPLEEIAANGVAIDARVSAPLLGSIFYDQNPLHDGAVVIRRDKILSAACRLPLSENPRLAPNLHMRHRAAVGITEQADCVAIVVSEERGTISIATDGILRRVTQTELRDALNKELRRAPEDGRSRHRFRSMRHREKSIEKPLL